MKQRFRKHRVNLLAFKIVFGTVFCTCTQQLFRLEKLFILGRQLQQLFIGSFKIVFIRLLQLRIIFIKFILLIRRRFFIRRWRKEKINLLSNTLIICSANAGARGIVYQKTPVK